MRHCNICGWSGERFNVLYNKRLRVDEETVCPVCGSLARQRALHRFLVERFVDGAGLTCLEIGPHSSNPVPTALPMASYASGGLAAPPAMHKVDLAALANVSESVDLLICSHVLEHIKDDVAAIREMYRVLRVGGTAVVQLPFGFEDDPGSKTVEFAEPRYYGHYRSYGPDVCSKLGIVGFHIDIVHCPDKRLVGELNEMLYICSKVPYDHSVSDSSEQPLVSVIIPTHNRAELLTTRSIPSVLTQTYQNFEIIVVADRCTDDTRDRIQKMQDPRIRFVELVDRPPLPDDLRDRWRVASGAPRNRGVQLAKGEWICLLDDDDEYTPRHIEALLREALTGYDFVYGKLLSVRPNGAQIVQGKYPPPEGGHISSCSHIYSCKYKNIEFNTDAAITNEPCDYNFSRRVIEAGAKVSFVDEIVYVHYRPAYIWETLAECEKKLATYERQLATREKQLATKSARIAKLESEIRQMRRSIPMLLADAYQRRVDKLLRRGTRPRRCYELGVTGIRVILHEGWHSFWKQFTRYTRSLRNDRGQA